MFFLWLGLITLIISSCILVITIEPFFTADSIDDIKNDWDENSGTFKSHKKGDRLKVSGKIIGVIETKNLLEENESVSDELLTESFGAKYIYVIEDQNFEVYSNEKIGNKGDYIILECEVDEVILNRWGQITDEKEVLKVKSHFNPFFPLIIEIALILISIFVIIKLITKRKALIKAESTPFQLAALYDEAKTDDEEKTLYEFMKAKKQVKVTQPIQPTKKISSFKVFQRQLRSKSPSGSKTKTTSKFSIFHMQSFSRPTSEPGKSAPPSSVNMLILLVTVIIVTIIILHLLFFHREKKRIRKREEEEEKKLKPFQERVLSKLSSTQETKMDENTSTPNIQEVPKGDMLQFLDKHIDVDEASLKSSIHSQPKPSDFDVKMARNDISSQTQPYVKAQPEKAEITTTTLQPEPAPAPAPQDVTSIQSDTPYTYHSSPAARPVYGQQYRKPDAPPVPQAKIVTKKDMYSYLDDALETKEGE